MDLVVVESPTKAKSIAKYLGAGYEVTASFGHVRDLLAEENAVRPEEDFELSFGVLEGKERRVKEIGREVKKAKRLILATDPDREGEAISWHLLTLLQDEGLLGKVEVQRVVFHEITKRAVTEAMRHPRDLDRRLIDAYLARRALDHLVGFRLSPVLWRKLQGAKSAGRVQSVALRLICEREDEIDVFVKREYWTIEALLKTPQGDEFTARLTRLDGQKLDKFALPDEASAKAATAQVEAAALEVALVERKQASRNPAPPFSTSTLQQEASRKLGFGTDRTMKTAQRLFEGIDLGGETVGLITYMRTDSVQLSNDALNAARGVIGDRYGQAYLPDQPRRFKTKTKNAQEAHEAIRPTDLARSPDQVAGKLDSDQRRLYELIWKRTVASQMAAAVFDRVTVDVADADDKLALRATGQTLAFDGFLKLYQEGRDDALDEDEAATLLPALEAGVPVGAQKVTPSQHFTEPPPRYTEASLVKRLEELGIGRPSTYAAIITTLQNRQYVRLESRRFVPEDRGRLVTAFLTAYFDTYVQPGFTAGLEDRLDSVAAGELEWKDVLRDFWPPFSGRIGEVTERRVAEIIDALNDRLAAKLFPPREDGGDPRRCPTCGEGELSLKIGRYGAFVGCSNYPECRFTRRFSDAAKGETGEGGQDRLLGVDPATAEEVWVKNGRFGPYVQSGSGDNVKRSSLAPGMDMAGLDLETALALLALPREVGVHPESGKPVVAGLNRRGPFVECDGTFATLPPDESVLHVGMNRALTLLAENGRKGRGTASPQGALKDLGPHPKDKKPVKVMSGRFGPYVKWGGINASLPKGTEPDDSFGMEQAVALIEAKIAKSKPAKAKGKAPAKAKAASEGADGTEPAKATAKKPAAKAKAAPAKKAG